MCSRRGSSHDSPRLDPVIAHGRRVSLGHPSNPPCTWLTGYRNGPYGRSALPEEHHQHAGSITNIHEFLHCHSGLSLLLPKPMVAKKPDRSKFSTNELSRNSFGLALFA